MEINNHLGAKGIIIGMKSLINHPDIERMMEKYIKNGTGEEDIRVLNTKTDDPQFVTEFPALAEILEHVRECLSMTFDRFAGDEKMFTQKLEMAVIRRTLLRGTADIYEHVVEGASFPVIAINQYPISLYYKPSLDAENKSGTLHLFVTN